MVNIVQRLPTTEGSQAASNVAKRSGSSSQQRLTRRHCSPSHQSRHRRFSMFNKKAGHPPLRGRIRVLRSRDADLAFSRS